MKREREFVLCKFTKEYEGKISGQKYGKLAHLQKEINDLMLKLDELTGHTYDLHYWGNMDVFFERFRTIEQQKIARNIGALYKKALNVLHDQPEPEQQTFPPLNLVREQPSFNGPYGSISEEPDLTGHRFYVEL